MVQLEAQLPTSPLSELSQIVNKNQHNSITETSFNNSQRGEQEKDGVWEKEEGEER